MEINLYVQGPRRTVEKVLDDLRDALEEFEAAVWRDHRLTDLEELAPYEGWVLVEVHHPMFRMRESALLIVDRAVRQADPELKVVTGGDVYLRPLE